ncbi:uncharacterized protein [Antedon mediterranea]|uniref:uncharacterized protein n=1 Tax=Antedon mediterranea TaxID=105859 RepID=UPI003AF64B97
MPFIKRTVEPVNVSDKPVPKCCRNELETVSNFTLCGLIRQLACLADQANSVFDEIGIETKLVFERTNSLILCVEKLKAKVHNLDARAVKVPESNLDDYSVFREHYHAQPKISKDLFTSATRPHCVKDLRLITSTNFTDILRKCQEYQADKLLVKSVMESRWVSAQDQIESQYELDVCKHVTHVLPKQRRKPTTSTGSPKTSRPLSDGDIQEDIYTRSKTPLPTPEEIARQNVLPSAVVSIDVTGCSFQRMSSLRRFDSKKNKRSSLRRRTIGGTAAPSIDQYSALPIVGLDLNQDNLSKTQSLDRSLILRRQSFNDGQYAIVQPIGTRKRPFSLRLQKRPKSLGKYEVVPEGKHVDFHGNGTSTVVRRSNKREEGTRKGIRVTMPDHHETPTSCQSCETLPPYNSADSLNSALEKGWSESSPVRPKSMELDRKYLQVGKIPKSASAEHIKRNGAYPLNKTNSSTMMENVSRSPKKNVAENSYITTHHSHTLDANVKLRSSNRRQDERQSSSGNWSESDSNRNSLQSDTNQSWISDASSSMISTCDSAVSMNCPEKSQSPEHDRSSSDVSQASDSTITNNGSQERLDISANKNIDSSQTEVNLNITHMDTESWLQSVGVMHPVLEKAFGNQAPMQKYDYDPAILSDTCSSSLTSIDKFENSSDISDDLEFYLGQSGSDVFDSSNSLCSIDTDGYWTSMHSDCGLPSMSRRQPKYMPPASIPIGYTSEESESGSRHSTRTPPRRTSPKMRLRKKKNGSPASERGNNSPKTLPGVVSPNSGTDKGTKVRPTSLKLPTSGPLSPNSRSSSPGCSDTTSDASSYDLPEPMRTPTSGGLYTICFTGSMHLDDMIKCTSERTQQYTDRSNSPSSVSSASYDDSPNNTLTRGSSMLMQTSTQTASESLTQTSTIPVDNPTHSDLWKEFENRSIVENFEEIPPGNQNSASKISEDHQTTTQLVRATKTEDQLSPRKSYYDHRYGIFVVETPEHHENIASPPLSADNGKYNVTKDTSDGTTCFTLTTDGKYLVKPKSSIPTQEKVSNGGRLSPPKFVTPSPRLQRKTVMTTDLDRVLEWNETSCGQPVVMVTKTNQRKPKEPSRPAISQASTSQIEKSSHNSTLQNTLQERTEPSNKSNDIWKRKLSDEKRTETDIVWQKQSPTQMRANKIINKDVPDIASPNGFGSEGYDTIKRSPRQKQPSTNSQTKYTSESIHVSIPTIHFGDNYTPLQTTINTNQNIANLQQSDQHVEQPNFLVNNNDIQKSTNNGLLNISTSPNQISDAHISSTQNEVTHQSPLASPVKGDRTLLDSPDSDINSVQSSPCNALPAINNTLCSNPEPSPSGSPVKNKDNLESKQIKSNSNATNNSTLKEIKQPPMIHIQLPGTNQILQSDSYIEFETGFGISSDKLSGNVYSSLHQSRRHDIFVQAEPSLQLISPVEKKAKNDSKNSFRNSYKEELQNSNNDPDLAIIRAAGKIEHVRQLSITPPKTKQDQSSHRIPCEINFINGLEASKYHSPSKRSEQDSSPRPNRNNSNHVEEGTPSSPTQYVFDPHRKPTFSILKKRNGESDKYFKSTRKERLSFLQASKHKVNVKNEDLYRKAVMASLSNAKGPFGSDNSINLNSIPTRGITFSDTVIVDHTPVKVCQVSGKPQTSLEDFRFLLQQQSLSPRTESAASALNVSGKNNRHNATELLVKSAYMDRSQVNGFPETSGGIKVVSMFDRKFMDGSGNSNLKFIPNPPSLESPTEGTKNFPMLSIEDLKCQSRQSLPIPPPDATFNWLKGVTASSSVPDRPSPGPSRSLLMEEIRRQSGSVSRLVAINHIDQQVDKKQTLSGNENDGGKPEFHGLFNSISTKVKRLPLAENVTESEHEYPTDAWD